MYLCVKHRIDTYQWTSIANLALGVRNFPDFRLPKQALINAFLLCLLPFAADVQTSSAQVHGAKVVNYFELSKSGANKNAIYADFA